MDLETKSNFIGFLRVETNNDNKNTNIIHNLLRNSSSYSKHTDIKAIDGCLSENNIKLSEIKKVGIKITYSDFLIFKARKIRLRLNNQ
jgi:hypothetical protein